MMSSSINRLLSSFFMVVLNKCCILCNFRNEKVQLIINFEQATVLKQKNLSYIKCIQKLLTLHTAALKRSNLGEKGFPRSGRGISPTDVECVSCQQCSALRLVRRILTGLGLAYSVLGKCEAAGVVCAYLYIPIGRRRPYSVRREKVGQFSVAEMKGRGLIKIEGREGRTFERIYNNRTLMGCNQKVKCT